MMKKAILLFVVVFISILSNGICVAENNPAVPDSINSQEKTELALLKMKQNHELMMKAVSDDKGDVLIPIGCNCFCIRSSGHRFIFDLIFCIEI